MRQFLPALLLSLAASHPTAATGLRYHGELLDQNVPANGRYDLRLTPFADGGSATALAPAVVFEDVLVEDGFFLLEPEFGARLANTEPLWIELGVRDADSTSAFAKLPERQKAELAPLVGQCWSTTGDSGVNSATNFLGTTDGAPLVLRSSGGIAINTSAPQDLLTLRGPDDFNNGPTLQLLGTGTGQTESGRVRFVEGASGTFAGAYVRYDGVANYLAIGGHEGSDPVRTADTDHIIIRRSAPSRMGVGKVPVEALDVAGNIQLEGGLKYANVAEHYLAIHAAGFSDRGDNNCNRAETIRQSTAFGAGNCGARFNLLLPDDARVSSLKAIFFSGSVATGSCDVRLEREQILVGSSPITVASVASQSGAGEHAQQVTGINAIVDNANRAYYLAASSREPDCAIHSVRIGYTLPNGFFQ